MFKLHYNNSKHTVTKFSLTELFFGRRLYIPMSSYDNKKLATKWKNKIKKQETRTGKKKDKQYIHTLNKFPKGRKNIPYQPVNKVLMQLLTNTNILQSKYSRQMK